MYRGINYKDRARHDEIAEYIHELNGKIATNNDARIRFKKIMELKGMGNSMSMTINGDVFTTFDDLWEASNLTQAEKDEIQLKIALKGKLIEAREQKGITQKRLAEMSGLKQPAIARLERMQTTPQIDTLFKVLKPLGYTLAIVPDVHAQTAD